MGRAPCCDKSRVKKGPWSAEEDALLMNFISKFGNGGNWIALPKKAGLNRCGKSCRLRWLNYLRPDIKHGDFTQEEDHIIYTLYHTMGSRWSVIASNLPGRTDNDVKNYWNTKLKKKILAGKVKNNDVLPTGNMGLEMQQNQHSLYLSGYTQSEEKYEQSRSSLSHEISSNSRSPDSDQNSSSSASIIMSSNGNENEFWMKLFSESFDEGVSSYQLEEKIIEIANLLDVSID